MTPSRLPRGLLTNLGCLAAILLFWGLWTILPA